MLSTNAALLDGASLAACLDGVGHLLSRKQIAAQLARDPTFLYQVRLAGGQGAGWQLSSCKGAHWAPSRAQPCAALCALKGAVAHCAPSSALPCPLPCPQFQPLEGQSRGERDAEYLADMFRAGP